MKNLLLAFGGATVVSAWDWTCPDGRYVGNAHVQLALMIDMAAFHEGDVWRTYRSELQGLVNELEVEYGSDTEVTVYSYSNKGHPDMTKAWCASCDKFHALPASDAVEKLEWFLAQYPNVQDRPLSDPITTKKYSSLGDVMFHFLASDHWMDPATHSDWDFVRIAHVATDVSPWVEGNTNFEGLPLPTLADVEEVSEDPFYYCNTTNYPSLSQTADLAKKLPVPTYFHFLSQKGEMPDDVQVYFKNHYLPLNLAGSPGWSDALPAGGYHKALSHQRIKDSICAGTLTTVAPTGAPTAVGECEGQIEGLVNLIR